VFSSDVRHSDPVAGPLEACVGQHKPILVGLTRWTARRRLLAARPLPALALAQCEAARETPSGSASRSYINREGGPRACAGAEVRMLRYLMPEPSRHGEPDQR